MEPRFKIAVMDWLQTMICIFRSVSCIPWAVDEPISSRTGIEICPGRRKPCSLHICATSAN